MRLTRKEKIAILQLLKNELLGDGAWKKALVEEAKLHNLWFSPRMTKLAIESIANSYLTEKELNHWLSPYKEVQLIKKVGIILAGNIPLVGFHDLLSVWMIGHQCLIKPSSKDKFLMESIIFKLIELDSRIKDELILEERLNNADAIIATGSNNTFRYFEYYFKNKPHLLRKNRIGVAAISGTETEEELDLLAQDAMLYFGLGCRNTAKLYLPQGYDILKLKSAFEKWNFVLENGKYKNNYDYAYAIYLMNKVHFYAFGPCVFLESVELHSRISCVNYEFYSDLAELKEKLNKNTDEIQCISSNLEIKNSIKFGSAQDPMLNQYADGVNTLEFLITL